MATSTLVGQNIGAGNVPRAEQVAKLAAIITFSVLTGLGILCVIFAPAIGRFFVPEDPRVVAEGAVYIRIVAWSFGFIGLQFALTGVLRAAGEMVPAMVIGLISQWVLQIPLAYFLSRHLGMGADGIWWSTPVANVVTAAIAGVWFARGTWKAKRLVGQPPIKAQQEEVELQAQME
jgi:Na+-driven multidrug efflux pump